LKSLQNKNENFKEKILIDNLFEEDALIQEKILIEKYGRKINGGVVCNVLNGGTQPPSTNEIRKIYGEEIYKKIRLKNVEKTKKTIFKRNYHYKEKIQNFLEKGYLIKDIAKELKVTRNSISRWIKLYNLKYDSANKKKLEAERLKYFREFNSKKVQKSAYIYVVITPDNKEITINKLVVFCKENKIDYKSLRNTFNKFKLNGENYKIKGFYIKQMFKQIISNHDNS
jgi:transposase